MPYKLIWSESSVGLETQVTELMEAGWKPQGGVAVSGWFDENRDGPHSHLQGNNVMRWAQAMVKD